MKRKLFDLLDVLLPAAFVATIAGTCFSGADYLFLRSIEHFMEREGWLSAGWESAHTAFNYGAVTAMTLVVTGLVGWLMFGAARKAQQDHQPQ